jgi:pyridoxamine 5'-phosphate oxidase
VSEPPTYGQPLREEDLDPDPFRQFDVWFRAAREAGVREPEAMTLATATPDGLPSARMVLLKGYGPQGFDLYSNTESRKGRELAANPRAALVVYWEALGRQVRVEGTVERLSVEEAEAYFRSRPLGSRLGAWASRQSEVIAGREEIERRLAEMEERFAAGEPPLPPWWGGYRVRPEVIEFWQHRESRLHDRLRYRREDGFWVVERLSP